MDKIVRTTPDSRREPRGVCDALRQAPVPADTARSRPFAGRPAERAVQGGGEGGTGWRADGAVLLLEVLHQEERCGQSSGGRESIDRSTQQTRA